MGLKRIERGQVRQKFSDASWGTRALVLSLTATEAALYQAQKHVASKHLRNAVGSVASFYRRTRLPAPSVQTVIDVSEMSRELNPFPVECVAESIAIWGLFQAGGHPAELRVGVRNVLGKTEAHLWVEYEGEVINDPYGEASTWQAFDRAWSPPSSADRASKEQAIPLRSNDGAGLEE